ncbi:uncharacterized protein LOC125231709 [Leguminivora glycinivorella]|uniref:uncharacterized protein LOC125231709 n=1 Tax=Leguminivora glycinivorella TaxID=1035111 RepID=UPI00201020A7|nr:uncharacterized protein LOC125231709 [Leguminivora glycinivorella]
MEPKTCDIENKDRLPIKVEEIIKKRLKTEGYINHKVITKAISTDGGNYLGSLYEVNVTGDTEDGKKETHLFVKCIIPGEHISVLSINEIFKTEAFFYNDLTVVFDEIQNEANVPAKERFNVAKSFHASIPEAIILENLSMKGYKTGFRMDVVSLKFAELSITQLGRLHGLSFAIEKKRPNYFDYKIRSLSIPHNFNKDFKDMIKKSEKEILHCLDCAVWDRFSTYLEKLWYNVPSYFNDQKYKRTIVHCDYRANNILMKEVDGEIIDVVPVDYQFMYYGCPVTDFLYFIFLGTDQEFRMNHLEYLKDLYFDSITKMLKYFNIDVESVFPREDFENLYTELLGFGLFSFVMIMPFIFAVEGEALELDKNNVGDFDIKCDERMKERARGVVDDFIRWGLM